MRKSINIVLMLFIPTLCINTSINAATRSQLSADTKLFKDTVKSYLYLTYKMTAGESRDYKLKTSSFTSDFTLKKQEDGSVLAKRLKGSNITKNTCDDVTFSSLEVQEEYGQLYKWAQNPKFAPQYLTVTSSLSGNSYVVKVVDSRLKGDTPAQSVLIDKNLVTPPAPPAQPTSMPVQEQKKQEEVSPILYEQHEGVQTTELPTVLPMQTETTIPQVEQGSETRLQVEQKGETATVQPGEQKQAQPLTRGIAEPPPVVSPPPSPETVPSQQMGPAEHTATQTTALTKQPTVPLQQPPQIPRPQTPPPSPTRPPSPRPPSPPPSPVAQTPSRQREIRTVRHENEGPDTKQFRKNVTYFLYLAYMQTVDVPKSYTLSKPKGRFLPSLVPDFQLNKSLNGDVVAHRYTGSNVSSGMSNDIVFTNEEVDGAIHDFKSVLEQAKANTGDQYSFPITIQNEPRLSGTVNVTVREQRVIINDSRLSEPITFDLSYVLQSRPESQVIQQPQPPVTPFDPSIQTLHVLIDADRIEDLKKFFWPDDGSTPSLKNIQNKLNQLDNFGNTPIMHAVCHGKVDAFKILMAAHSKSSTDITNLKNKRSQTILHLAAQSGDWETFQEVVAFVNLNDEEVLKRLTTYDSEGFGLLHCIAFGGNVDILKFCLDRKLTKFGLPIDNSIAGGVTSMKKTILHIAVENNKYDFCKYILYSTVGYIKAVMGLFLRTTIEKGSNILRDTNISIPIYGTIGGSKPKYSSVFSGDPLWRFINAQDINGKTAMHYAVDLSLNNIIGLLMRFKAKADIKNNDEKTAIYCAVESLNPILVNLLLKKATSIATLQLGPKGNTLIHAVVLKVIDNEAKITEATKIIQALVKAGVRLDDVNGDGYKVHEYLHDQSSGQLYALGSKIETCNIAQKAMRTRATSVDKTSFKTEVTAIASENKNEQLYFLLDCGIVLSQINNFATSKMTKLKILKMYLDYQNPAVVKKIYARFGQVFKRMVTGAQSAASKAGTQIGSYAEKTKTKAKNIAGSLKWN